jgi:hypothetical protein
MPDIRPGYPELELQERTTEAARWAAADALLDLVAAHPEDKTYILAQHFDAFARAYVVSKGQFQSHEESP